MVTEKSREQSFRGCELSPYLKPRKHTYFDTVQLKAFGEHKEMLFSRYMHFPNGDDKRMGVDTNMNLCSQLGTPLIFDLVMWSVAFEEFGDGDDIRTVLSNTKFTFNLGFDRYAHSCVGSMFYPGIKITDGLSSDWITPKKQPLQKTISNYKKATKQIRGALSLMARKKVWTHWYGMMDVAGKARRIESRKSVV